MEQKKIKKKGGNENAKWKKVDRLKEPNEDKLSQKGTTNLQLKKS